MIFLSYAKADHAFASKLAGDLRQRGHEVWLDAERIAAGENWAREIEQAIAQSDVVLYLATPASGSSSLARGEVLRALRQGKKIVVVSPQQSDVPVFLESTRAIDFERSYEAGLHELLEGLGAGRATSPAAKAPPTPAHPSKGYFFLSYAEEDIDFIHLVRKFLAQHGYAYFDYAESDRDYHGLYVNELEEVITQSAATIAVLSAHWKRSAWAVKELLFSQDVGTPVFLLKAKPLGPTLVIAGQNFIDFTQSVEDGFRRLSRELSRHDL